MSKCFYKGDEVLRHRTQKRKGKKTGYIRVFLKKAPDKPIMVSFPDWDKGKEMRDT
jgi:hypothetical protein